MNQVIHFKNCGSSGVIPFELERPPRIDAEQKEQNQENIVHRDRYSMAQSNIIDFSISSNVMIQDNLEEKECYPHPEKELWN